jgi:hypothetical protein
VRRAHPPALISLDGEVVRGSCLPPHEKELCLEFKAPSIIYRRIRRIDTAWSQGIIK